MNLDDLFVNMEKTLGIAFANLCLTKLKLDVSEDGTYLNSRIKKNYSKILNFLMSRKTFRILLPYQRVSGLQKKILFSCKKSYNMELRTGLLLPSIYRVDLGDNVEKDGTMF